MNLRNVFLASTIILLAGSPVISQQFHGVCVGVANYADTTLNLSCPDDNAEDFRSYLITYQNWNSNEIELLLDDDAGEQAIKNNIAAMTQDSGHTCLFFYSGHGSSDELGGTDGLYPYSQTYLEPSELQACFTAGYGQYACFIDACGSGCFADHMTRGVISAACETDELEWESRNGYSYWVSFLLPGLYNDAADSDAQGDDNGVVSAQELFAYARDRTTDYCSSMHPQLFSPWGPDLHFEPCPWLSIDGPFQVEYGEQETWTVEAHDGQTPYSYAWYHRKLGGSWYSGGTSSSASIYLDYAGTGTYQVKCVVTDYNDAYDEEYMNVMVEEGGGNDKVSSARNPDNFDLFQNYPNPFNPVTNIKFQLPEAVHVKLIIYDVTGKEVIRLVDEAMPAGFHETSWVAGNIASGVYIYKLSAGDFSDIKRMVLIK